MAHLPVEGRGTPKATEEPLWQGRSSAMFLFARRVKQPEKLLLPLKVVVTVGHHHHHQASSSTNNRQRRLHHPPKPPWSAILKTIRRSDHRRLLPIYYLSIRSHRDTILILLWRNNNTIITHLYARVIPTSSFNTTWTGCDHGTARWWQAHGKRRASGALRFRKERTVRPFCR